MNLCERTGVVNKKRPAGPNGIAGSNVKYLEGGGRGRVDYFTTALPQHLSSPLYQLFHKQ